MKAIQKQEEEQGEGKNYQILNGIVQIKISMIFYILFANKKLPRVSSSIVNPFWKVRIKLLKDSFIMIQVLIFVNKFTCALINEILL
jgi:hypothetical protein